jgi:hypothetical protein
MAAWLALDADFSAAFSEPLAGPGPSSMAHMEERLRAYIPAQEEIEEDDLSPVDESIPTGQKRKLYVSSICYIEITKSCSATARVIDLVSVHVAD